MYICNRHTKKKMDAETMTEVAPTSTPNRQQELERMRAYKKQWRMNHKEEIKLYQRKYMKNNNLLTTCGICGGEFKQYGRGLHDQTTKHKNKVKIQGMENKIKALENRLNIPV